MRLAEWRASRTARAAFWAAVCFAFAMAVIPHPPELPGNPNDKVQHIAAFAVLTLFGAFAYPKALFVRLFGALSLFGAFIELVQAIPALHRDSDVRDWLADTIAIAVVMLVVRGIEIRSKAFRIRD